MLVVGEKGQGDNFGIGCSKAYSILEIAKMFDTKIVTLPERKGNRMDAEVICDKTKSLGWSETKSIRNHIKEFISGIN